MLSLVERFYIVSFIQKVLYWRLQCSASAYLVNTTLSLEKIQQGVSLLSLHPDISIRS